MKKQKIISLLAAVSVGVSLVACGGGSSVNGSGEATIGSAGKTKLTLWHIQTATAADSLANSARRFMEQNPQYDVEVIQMQNDSYKQKLSMAMSAGETPDIFVHWGGSSMIDYVEAGQCSDLTAFMNQDGYQELFVDAGIEQCTYNEKIYAVPVENISVAGIFYNKEVFQQYGLEEPKTIAELEVVCDKLIEGGIAPFALANATKWTGSMYFQYLATRQGGLEPFKAAAAGEGSFEDPTFIYAGETIQKWVEKGYFNEGFNGMDDDSGQARQLFYTGQAAMDLMGSWFSGTVIGENPDFINNVGFFPFPALENSSADQSLCVGTVGDNLYSISEKCQDKEGAFRLIQSLLDEEAQAERKALGKIIPLKSFEPEDELTKEILEVVNNARGIQLWYDQYLPSEVAEVHKTTSQEIFGLIKTPEQANNELQKALEDYLSKN